MSYFAKEDTNAKFFKDYLTLMYDAVINGNGESTKIILFSNNPKLEIIIQWLGYNFRRHDGLQIKSYGNKWTDFHELTRFRIFFNDKEFIEQFNLFLEQIFKKIEAELVKAELGKQIPNVFRSELTYICDQLNRNINSKEVYELLMRNSVQKILTENENFKNKTVNVHALQNPFRSLTLYPQDPKQIGVKPLFYAALIFPRENDIIIKGYRAFRIWHQRRQNAGQYLNETYTLDKKQTTFACTTKGYFGKHSAENYYLILTDNATYTMSLMEDVNM